MSRPSTRPRGLFIGLLALASGLALAACADEFQRTEPEQLPEPATTYDVSAEAPPVVPACGNGEDDPGEECDDGNGINTDGCTNTCRLTPAPLCVPCSNDGDCGRDVDLCLDLGDDGFCARDCTDLPCPRGYECREILEGEEVIAEQCAPPDDVCPECPDDDGDGVCNGDDICPFGDDDADEDADGNPDACELCPGEDDTVDSDRDGIPDGCDCGGLGADCSVNAFCFVGDGDPTCECRPGFTGDGISCQDINECAEGTDNCADEADCINTLGGFMCVCGEGFTGDGLTCTDIDECATDADDCVDPAVCTNTVGSFTCSCAAGFIDTTGDATACIDINECALALDDCDPVAECTNTPGGFTCTCPDGYDPGDTGGTTCTDIDECAAETDNCSDNGLCFNLPGSFECMCAPGFEGDGVTCAESFRVAYFPGYVNDTPMQAAELLGFDWVSTNTTSELNATLDAGAAAAIINSNGPLPDGVPRRITEWVDAGGDLIIHTNAFTERSFSGLAQAMQVGVGGGTGFLLDQPDPETGIDILLGVYRTYLNTRALTPFGEDGRIFARKGTATGPGFITLTRGGRVFTNSRVPTPGDNDGDGVPDMAELFRNELAYLMTPDDYPLLNATFDTSTAGWFSASEDGDSNSWDAQDADGSDTSGSLRFSFHVTEATADPVAAIQCFPVNGPGGAVASFSFRTLEATGAELQLSLGIAAFTTGGCDASEPAIELVPIPNVVTAAWEVNDAPLAIALPDAVRSVALGVLATAGTGGGDAEVLIDNVSVELLDSPCSETGDPVEAFGPDMFGCGGTVTFANNATLCAEGWDPCTAAEWVARRAGAEPSRFYWTADVLHHQSGDSSGDCSVSTNVETHTLTCTTSGTFLVTTASGVDPVSAVSTSWVNCGLETNTPNEFFGGCISSDSASTLCCQ